MRATSGTPGSFSTIDIVTWPTSLKIVGHGFVAAQGSGDVTQRDDVGAQRAAELIRLGT